MPVAVYHPDRIAKNTSYMTMALIVQKVLSFAYFAYISRAVGEVNTGEYLFAFSLSTAFGIFIDFGLSPVITRETAKSPDKSRGFATTILSYKLITGPLLYGLLLATVFLLGQPPIVRTLVLVSGLVMILDSFTLSFYSILRGNQILKYESIGTIINKLLVMALGVIGLETLGLGVRWLVLAILGGSLFNFLYSAIRMARRTGWRPAWHFDWSTLRPLLVTAVPFALANIFVTIYGAADSILLKTLTGERGAGYVGWYGTASKLALAFQFIPIAVGAAIYPAMSSYFISSRDLLRRTFERGMFYLLVLAVPLAVSIGVMADIIIPTVWGQAFSAAILPLQILSGSLLFVFLNYPIGALLNATNHQFINTRNVAIVLVTSVLANLLVIPRWTFVGTSAVNLATTALWFGLNLWSARRIIDFNGRWLFIVWLKTLLAAAVMAGVLLLIRDSFPLVSLIVIAPIAYFAMLAILRGFGQADFLRIYRSVRRRAVKP